MSNPYATTSDLTTHGLPANALGQLTTAQQQAALDAEAGVVDSILGARYGAQNLPLAPPVPVAVTQAVCKRAAYRLLQIRGYNPEHAGDKAILQAYIEVTQWLDDIRHQRAHLVGLNMSPSPPAPSPVVLSTSVVDVSSGATQPNRGW